MAGLEQGYARKPRTEQNGLCRSHVGVAVSVLVFTVALSVLASFYMTQEALRETRVRLSDLERKFEELAEKCHSRRHSATTDMDHAPRELDGTDDMFEGYINEDQSEAFPADDEEVDEDYEEGEDDGDDEDSEDEDDFEKEVIKSVGSHVHVGYMYVSVCTQLYD